MKDLYLSDYQPKSQCITHETKIEHAKFNVIDIHQHLGKLVLGDNYKEVYELSNYLKELDTLNIKHVVNLDGVWGIDMDQMLNHTQSINSILTTFTWIDVSRIDDEDFDSYIKKHLYDAYSKGVRGIKMWKVISLNQKDKAGNYIRTDDSRLKVVYETAAELSIPILIHIADPVAFFDPINEENERYEELIENPDWSFGKEGQFSFLELMDMQDNMIRNNPNTTFIVAHFGSYAENLQHVSNRLDQFPNMFIDIAARIAELGRVPYSSRNFFIKYSSKILYGTDCTPINLNLNKKYFRFLETFDEYFEYQEDGETPGQGRWRIYGIGLPDEVLKDIYYRNACKILNLDIKQFE